MLKHLLQIIVVPNTCATCGLVCGGGKELTLNRQNVLPLLHLDSSGLLPDVTH